MTDMTDFFAAFENDDLSPIERAVEPMRGKLTDAVTARQYMRAGNATVTLKSKKTETRFTYRLRASDDGNATFVGVLTGSDNESQYSYLGRIWRDVFYQGRRVPRAGDITSDAPSMKAFAWTWKQLVQGKLPDSLEIYHEGSCGRCGRKLTVPESIARGIGPECYSKMGVTMMSEVYGPTSPHYGRSR
jgi:hypothetical protein